MPERVAAPRRAKVIVRENAFSPAGMVERTHRVRVGVWGRGAPNDRVVSVARCGSGVERQRGSGPAAPANAAIPARRAQADQLSERPRSLGRVWSAGARGRR